MVHDAPASEEEPNVVSAAGKTNFMLIILGGGLEQTTFYGGVEKDHQFGASCDVVTMTDVAFWAKACIGRKLNVTVWFL